MFKFTLCYKLPQLKLVSVVLLPILFIPIFPFFNNVTGVWRDAQEIYYNTCHNLVKCSAMFYIIAVFNNNIILYYDNILHVLLPGYKVRFKLTLFVN